MFGGAGVALQGVVPSDILVEDNLLTKDLAWRGSSWTVKNLFELKSARRVVVRGNTMEYNWQAGQPGFAIVLHAAQLRRREPVVGGRGRRVRLQHRPPQQLGFQYLGPRRSRDQRTDRPHPDHDNLLEDISSANWGGAGTSRRSASSRATSRSITTPCCTPATSSRSIRGSYYNASGVRVTAGPTPGFVFTNNFMKHNAYGIFGNNQAWATGRSTTTRPAPSSAATSWPATAPSPPATPPTTTFRTWRRSWRASSIHPPATTRC